MRTLRDWSLAGLVAGVAGFATSYLVAMALTLRDSPLTAVGQMIIRVTPGTVAEHAIALLGKWDKPVLLGIIFVLLCLLFALAGLLARVRWWAPMVVYVFLGAFGAFAVSLQRGTTTVDYLPVIVGFLTWPLVLALLVSALRRTSKPQETGNGSTTRRNFMVRAGLVALGALVVSGAGKVVGASRRHVEETRRLLRLDNVTEPRVPAGARLGVDGVTPWLTPSDEFYRVHTALAVPTIEPRDWRLHIHGLVDEPLVLTYQDLLKRRTTEAWITLNCVSNPVGGPLIGNAWWSGVRIASLLKEVGVREGADAVLQTSDDGWTCGTPLSALTDGRDALLAVAMNGRPLPIDHGFPVRTVVPGLYGYVSACKWVVDIEVTRFDKIAAYWVDKGWAEQAPVKMASRIDVPRSGADVAAGSLRVGGVAWAQHTGISAVEVALDGGDWQEVEIGKAPTTDTWVQWAGSIEVSPGDHVLRVRATDRDGIAQTGVERDVLPDGATGWHTIEFTAEA